MDVKMRNMICACGISWAAPETFMVARENDHETFYCPRGCSRYFPQKSNLELCQEAKAKLEEQLDNSFTVARRLRRERESIERRRISQKGATTKLRKQLDELKEA